MTDALTTTEPLYISDADLIRRMGQIVAGVRALKRNAEIAPPSYWSIFPITRESVE